MLPGMHYILLYYFVSSNRNFDFTISKVFKLRKPETHEPQNVGQWIILQSIYPFCQILSTTAGEHYMLR